MAASYSFRWARETFEDFRNCHPRATAFLLEIFNLPVSAPIRWLAKDQERWWRFKKAVKWVEACYASVDAHFEFDYYKSVKYWRRLLTRESLDKFAAEVDKEWRQLILEEQPKEVEAGRERKRSE